MKTTTHRLLLASFGLLAFLLALAAVYLLLQGKTAEAALVAPIGVLVKLLLDFLVKLK